MGNLDREGLGSLVFDSQTLGLADTSSQSEGGFHKSCRERDNSQDTFAFTGSRFFQGGRGGYGPWRSEPGSFKVKGGSGHPASIDQSAQPGLGAPCSSTPAQTFAGTAAYGTPRARLARLMIDILEGEDHSMSDAILTPGQQALYVLCKQDLLMSCQAYEEGWGRSKGQQCLVDLKRMENVLHKIQAVQGAQPTLPTNVYVIGQALTSRLTNPGNLCYGNSAFRCWSWAGAHAEDQILAWGRTHPLAGEERQEVSWCYMVPMASYRFAEARNHNFPYPTLPQNWRNFPTERRHHEPIVAFSGTAPCAFCGWRRLAKRT